MCVKLGCAVYHPPPGQPRHIPVVEREVGISLQGISCYLRSAGLPNVFWPFASRCFAFNYALNQHNKATGLSAYEVQFGDYKFELSITGELVFFIPAPTIVACKAMKVESNLVAGNLPDYYKESSGKLTGQYICVCVEAFVGKILHRRMDRRHFKLRLHRTEVSRRPADWT